MVSRSAGPDVLDKLLLGLQERAPKLISDTSKGAAAVAAVFRKTGSGAEVLFIHRTEREGDPWSGHVGFPGGRVDENDADCRTTAERETLEELNLDLQETDFAGQLDDITGVTIPVCVSGFVYVATGIPVLVPNQEVRDAFWFNLGRLAEPSRQVERTFEIRGEARPYPGIELDLAGKPVLWGLTYRFVLQILDLAGLRSC